MAPAAITASDDASLCHGVSASRLQLDSRGSEVWPRQLEGFCISASSEWPATKAQKRCRRMLLARVAAAAAGSEIPSPGVDGPGSQPGPASTAGVWQVLMTLATDSGGTGKPGRLKHRQSECPSREARGPSQARDRAPP